MKKETLSLTINIDDGRLLVLLTDTKRLSTYGWARTDLQNIRNVAAAVEPAVLQELVFPASVSKAIAQSSADILLIQIQPELTFLPIEAFQSSGKRWCEQFAITCYLPKATPNEYPTSNVATNPQSEPIQIAFTDSLNIQDYSRTLVNYLTEQGLSVISNDARQHTVTAVIACSANDAMQFMRNNSKHPPAICAWPTSTLSDASGSSVAQFCDEFPACAVLTGQRMLSTDDLITSIRPVLTAVNSGLSLVHAVQRAMQDKSSGAMTIRLYNGDDIPLCSASTISQSNTENRTITALSLDVVASTRMMQRLGNEQYSEVLATLKEQCMKCIYERGGSSGGRAGDDSTMAYFGLPNALENTANCAMDTALAVHAILPTLPGQPQLRIGIATGRVAVRSGIPYGEPIHLAARLQAFGSPGDVIVDTASQWLARQNHAFEPCGDYTTFHGIEHPVLPVKLISHAGEDSTSSVLENHATFIGRAAELKELTDCWQRVCLGQQLVVCVRGEAGIGKTRLVREFLSSVLPDGARLLKFRGLSDYQSGVFYSLTESIKRTFGIQPDDSHAQVMQRVQDVASYPPLTVHNIALLAEELGITQKTSVNTNSDHASKRTSDVSLRTDIFSLLTEAIDVAARDKPLVLLIDDLQWIGPSVREALEHVIDELHKRTGLRLLVLCTERDEQLYRALPNASMFMLRKLAPRVAHQFIRNVVGESLPTESVNQLVNRAEGIPLFLEESARLVLEMPMEADALSLRVPDSIENLLMSRLDTLEKSGKYLVQVASVIGQDVQIEFLESVVKKLDAPHDPIGFQEQIKLFREIGVLNDLKAKGPARLTFRHEMIRDVAYNSMWQRDRITVHAAIARVILTDESDRYAGQPGMIARHLTLSEQHKLAAIQWEVAARIAADESANQEAIENLRSALQSLQHLINSEHTAKQEMRVQLMLAARLIASEGYGAEEVRTAYERAEILVRQFGTEREQLKVMLGLESVHVMRGDLDNAQSLAVASFDIANELPDKTIRDPMIIQTRWALGNICFHQGYPEKALSLMDQCLNDCHAITHNPSAVQDPEIMCLCYSSWVLWEQGFSDTAYNRAAQSVTLAKSRQHRFSEAQAIGFYASLSLFRGDYDAAIANSDIAIAICEKENFVVWLAHARVMKGRALALTGKQEQGLALMQSGYQQWVDTGAVITKSFYLTLIAETLLEAGEINTALETINEANGIATRTGDRYHLAETLRIQGLVAYANEDLSGGDSNILRAIDVAYTQKKQSFVLRSVSAMAQSLASRGKVSDSILALEHALSPLSEGLSTHDLAHATALLSTWTSLVRPDSKITQSPGNASDISMHGCIVNYPKSAND